jgi:hypothetical protein
MSVAPETIWKGTPIRVTARIVPRYAWLTTSIDVAVDGRVVLKTGGVRKVVGVHDETVEVDGVRRRLSLAWGAFSSGSFPFSLAIDDAVVLESRVSAPYWWVAYWPIVVCILLGIALGRMLP